jgi:hypothetical protein
MEVRVDLIYPKLEFISDRTFRESLKLASREIHAIHLNEVEYLITTSSLSSQQKQSIWDRMRKQLDPIPNYYIESVRRGSLEIVIALSAAAYFLLEKTMGKTIEAAWERTASYRWLVRFLSNSSTPNEVPAKRAPTTVDTKSRGPEGERWQWLEREFSSRFLNRPRFGRFKVVDVATHEDPRGDMRVRITFDLADEFSELEGTFRQLLYADFISKHLGERRKALSSSRKRTTKPRAKR